MNKPSQVEYTDGELEGGSKFRSYGKTGVWELRLVHIGDIFLSYLDYPDSSPSNATDNLPKNYYCPKSRNLSIVTLVEETKPVILEKYEFEFNDISSFNSNFGIHGVPGIWSVNKISFSTSGSPTKTQLQPETLKQKINQYFWWNFSWILKTISKPSTVFLAKSSYRNSIVESCLPLKNCQ